MQTRIRIASSVLLLLLGGCKPDFNDLSSKTFCRQDSDCLSGRVCIQQQCVDPERVNLPDVPLVSSRDAGVRDSTGNQPFDSSVALEDVAREPRDVGHAGDVTDTGSQPVDVYVPPVLPPTRLGDVLVTELMIQPWADGRSDPRGGQWIELSNQSDGVLVASGWQLGATPDGPGFALPEGLELPPGEHLIIGRSDDQQTNGGVVVDVVLPDLVLGLERGMVWLRGQEGLLLDEVTWVKASWPMALGAAVSLDPTKMDPGFNDLSGSWCASPSGIVMGGDRGSPGSKNPPCPDSPPSNCESAIDVSDGGLFGWDLMLVPGGLMNDHNYYGRCDTPNEEGRYTLGRGARDVLFRFRSNGEREWTLELEAVRRGADLAFYVRRDPFCLLDEACADDIREPNGEVSIHRARIQQEFMGNVDHFIVVDGVTRSVTGEELQPFTLRVTPGPLRR